MFDVRRLTAIVLFTLVTTVLASLPGQEVFRYFRNARDLISYGIIPFLLLFAYLITVFIRRSPDWLRTGLLGFLIVAVLGGLLSHQIWSRHQSGPATFVIDGAVQTEEAARFLRTGVNPYSADYKTTPFGTYLDTFSNGERPNPAWDHYVYLPGTFLLTVPFQKIAELTIGWFDVRWLYAAGFGLVLLIIGLTVRAPYRDLALTLVAFHPYTYRLLLFGVNDYLLLGWLLAGVLLLQNRRLGWSSVCIALALSMKQSAWLFIPFYLLAVIRLSQPGQIWTMLRKLWPGLVLTVLLFAPFFLWSPNAFLDDVWRYANGSAQYSYPASGIGLSQWFVTLGVIKDKYDPYPFWIFSLLISLPVFIFLLRRQWQSNSPANLLWFYGAALLAYWFVARYFNDTHLVFLLTLLGIAAFYPKEPLSQRS